MYLKEICKQIYLDGSFILIENLLHLFLQIAIALYLLNLIFGIIKQQQYFAGFIFVNRDQGKVGKEQCQKNKFHKNNSVKFPFRKSFHSYTVGSLNRIFRVFHYSSRPLFPYE